jgi:hypothetical protein
MKQFLSLFLFLVPCLAWAQYPSNGNQKITLGEQTTADGIIWRGVSSDTTLTTKSDTAAYFVLDTVNKKLYFYKASAIPKWNEISGSGGGGAGTVTSITGGTGLTGGTITTSGTLAADTNFLVTRFDTASMLTNYYRSGRTGIIQASDVPTLNQNTTGSAATLTTSRTFQTNLASTSTASFNGSANVTPGVTGTLPVANGGTNASTFTSGSVVFAGSSGTYTQDNSNLFFDNGNDRLGVATNTPTQKLHVVGNAYITNKIGVGLDPAGIGGAVLGLQTTNNNTEYFRGYNATGSTRFGWDLVSDEAVLTLFGNNDVKMRTNGNSYLNGGNVGIGTTSPLNVLQIGSTFPITFNANYPQIHFNSYYSSGYKVVTTGYGSHMYLDGATGKLIYQTGSSSVSAGSDYNPTTKFVIESNGNVGIGTATPTFKLDVNGTGRFSGELTGTSATFSSTVTNNVYSTPGSIATPFFNDVFLLGTTNSYSKIQWGNEFNSTYGTYLRFIVNGASNFNTPVTALTLLPSGAATFSSSVTGNRYIINGSNGNAGQIIQQGDLLGTAGTNLLLQSNTGNAIGFLTNGGTTFNMFINTSGNVGIGTTSPSSKLEIAGFSTGAGLKLNYGNSSGTIEAVNFIANGGANGVIGMQMVSAGVGDLWLGGSGGRTLTLYRDGNVGIGTESPTRGLTINRSGGFASLNIVKGNTTNQIVYLGTGSSGADDLGLLQLSDGGTVRAQIYTGGNSYFNGGNVGIGTTSPAALLDVRSTMRVSGDGINFGSSANDVTLSSIVYTNATGGIDVKSLAKLGLYSAGTERIHITTGGNVGISRTPTTNALEVNGNASKTTAGDWLAHSDSTIKTEIHTVDGALDRINKVRLVSFKYKDEYKLLNPSIKDKFYQNVIAQEYQEIYPDYVYQSGDIFEGKNILQVDTNPMYIDAVASIQELSILVKELSAQVDILKQEIINLKNK